MSNTIPSILGQSKPAANVDTNLFTVPYGTQAQFSLFVCNQSPVVDYFTIALVQYGTPTSPENPSNYIAYNTPLIGNGVFAASGLYLNMGDQVRITSAGGNCSVTATGVIITN